MLTKNDIRYIIRKEFFGGIVWDSIHKDYYMISLGDFYKIENEGKLEKGDLSINNNYRLPLLLSFLNRFFLFLCHI